MTSAAAAPQGTSLTSAAACPAGKEALGGGGLITGTPAAAGSLRRAQLVGSYPDTAASWTAQAVLNAALAAGTTVSLQAYVLCSE